MKKTPRYLVPLLLLVVMVLCVMMLVKNSRLNNANVDLQVQIEEADRKERVLKKKYAEERAKAQALQRSKMAADSKVRDLESSASELKAALEQAQASEADAVKNLKRKLSVCGSDLGAANMALKELKAKSAVIQANLEKAVSDINQKENLIAGKNVELNNLQAQLSSAMSKIARAVDHNRKLSELAEQLLAEFDTKDVFQMLLEKEPFTQQKRIQLERMIQVYLDGIDQETLSDSDTF